ncbi:hypothetical protein AGRO_5197 [Agrobacterium sp. ATCC 31749]|uniref:hypothetical protein n=1 Tax=unclassified Agrobacterium TaxID=2632611 RepID=UPI00020DBE6B|nr:MULTISPECIES: hypothetical protein [unclassified Agrobacterium]EGL62123.1 hypothetical protein AGRO_5197 [Agrobacterium sp. ATCC 31749]QKX00476.1 hypothetical protein GSF67_25370 [Agrobacterium sp. CGMCC 11546]
MKHRTKNTLVISTEEQRADTLAYGVTDGSCKLIAHSNQKLSALANLDDDPQKSKALVNGSFDEARAAMRLSLADWMTATPVWREPPPYDY